MLFIKNVMELLPSFNTTFKVSELLWSNLMLLRQALKINTILRQQSGRSSPFGENKSSLKLGKLMQNSI